MKAVVTEVTPMKKYDNVRFYITDSKGKECGNGAMNVASGAYKIGDILELKGAGKD